MQVSNLQLYTHLYRNYIVYALDVCFSYASTVYYEHIDMYNILHVMVIDRITSMYEDSTKLLSCMYNSEMS